MRAKESRGAAGRPAHGDRERGPRWQQEADFVRGLDDVRCSWMLFGTFTFETRVNDREGHERFQVLCRRLAQRVGEHVWVAWGWGPQPLRGGIHFHSLFGLEVGTRGSLRLADVTGVKARVN